MRNKQKKSKYQVPSLPDAKLPYLTWFPVEPAPSTFHICFLFLLKAISEKELINTKHLPSTSNPKFFFFKNVYVITIGSVVLTIMSISSATFKYKWWYAYWCVYTPKMARWQINDNKQFLYSSCLNILIVRYKNVNTLFIHVYLKNYATTAALILLWYYVSTFDLSFHSTECNRRNGPDFGSVP